MSPSAPAEARYRVDGMHCASCVSRVERAAAGVPGVDEVAVNLALNELRVRPADGAVPEDALAAAVEGAGYHLVLDADTERPADVVRQWRRRFLFAAAFTAPLLAAMARPLVPGAADWPASTVHLVLFLLALPVYAVAGAPFHRAALRGARHGAADMNTLVSVGTTAAFLYSAVATFAPAVFTAEGVAPAVYFDTVGVITTLVLMGRWLEARAREKTTDAVRGLAELAPETARRVGEDGEETQVPVADLVPGDHIRVRPGEALPADGRVAEGEATVDESMVTGEPLPVTRAGGAEVITGTVLAEGSLLVTVERVGGDTFLARMVRRVQEAQGSRAPSQRLADRVASVFVPVVLGVALVTAVAWWFVSGTVAGALIPAVAVLLIACPCALGLATPAAVLVGIGAGARAGILIADGEVLETLGRTEVALLDKTGTVTRGRPAVTAVHPAPGIDADDLVRWAAATEAVSEHPLAEAVRAAAAERGLRAPAARNFRSRAGRGVIATVEDAEVAVGTEAFLAEREVTGLEAAASAEWAAGGTVLLVARGGAWIGALVADDPVRAESPETLDRLRDLGLEPWLVTGDRAETAERVAAELGIEHVRARTLPEGKGDLVAELQAGGRRVLFAGDGVNDAPALARADAGVALGSGTDIARQAAAVTLLHEDLRLLPGAVRLSRATVRVIRQNLFWAFVYNVVGIPLAAGALVPLTGWQLHPMMAAGAMALSSVSVLTNALRLRGFDPRG